ncbi:hypothetical protein AURDEDRAFT_159914 [Auricularia subglabra TFB-10046 SS5]|nr:hypothetical protein AURDEDRAFT_159914 [Auricularia subglabra TFB-10046 SS5]
MALASRTGSDYILGARKVEHLTDNIKALEISLSQEQIDYIDSISPIDLGFPHNVGTSLQTSRNYSIQAPVDKVPAPQVIRLTKQT